MRIFKPILLMVMLSVPYLAQSAATVQTQPSTINTQQTTEAQAAAYEQALADYEVELAKYEAEQKAYDEQLAAYNTEAQAAADAQALADYQAELAKYEAEQKAYDDAQAAANAPQTIPKGNTAPAPATPKDTKTVTLSEIFKNKKGPYKITDLFDIVPGVKALIPPFFNPIFNAVQITDVVATANEREMSVTAFADILKQQTAVAIKQVRGFRNEAGYGIFIGFPAGISLGAIDKKLGVLDKALQVISASMVFSTVNYFDADWGVPVGEGANLILMVKVAGILDEVLKPIGTDLTTLMLTVNLSPTIVGSDFNATLPGKIQLGEPGQKPIIETTGLSLGGFIGDTDITLYVSTGLQLNLPWQKTPLIFSASLLGTLTGNIAIEGNMDGQLSLPFPPFGFPNGTNVVTFGDVFIKLAIDAALIAQSSGLIPISGFGLGAGITCGDVAGRAKLYFNLSGSNAPDIFVDAAVNNMTYDKILGCYGKVLLVNTGMQVDITKVIKEKVPPFGLREIKVYFAPKDMFLGLQVWRKGIKVTAKATFPWVDGPKDCDMEISITMNGIMMRAYCQTLNVGPLKIFGRGPDRKAGTKDDGPIMLFNFAPKGSWTAPATPDELDKMAVDTFKEPTKEEVVAQPAAQPYVMPGNVMGQGPMHAISLLLSAGLQLKVPVKSGKDIMLFEAEALLSIPAPTRLTFDFNTAIYSKFKAQLKGDFNIRAPNTWKLQGSIIGLKDFGKELRKGARNLQKAKKKVSRAFDKAQDEVKKAQKKLGDTANLKKRLDEAVAGCKGKAPKKFEKKIDEVAEGKAVSAVQVDQ